MDQVRMVAPVSAGIGAMAGSGAAASAGGFGDALAKALESVNQSQNEANDLGRRFQLGDPGASLEDTMIAMQKSNISLQAAVQVRNRLVSAYHDIMNMQV